MRMGIRTLPGRTQSFKLKGGGSVEPPFLFDATLSSEWAFALCPGELKVSSSMVAAAFDPSLVRRITLKRMGIRTLPGRTQSFKLNGGGSVEPQFGFDASLSGGWASAICPGELTVSKSMVAAALNPNLGLTHHTQANGHPHSARANSKFQDQWWWHHL